MVDPNTRTGKRTPVTLKIKFKSETLEQFIERYAVDVSQGGIFIRTKEPLAVGTQMRFEFQLRDASPLIGGEGTVVWTRENDPSRPAIAPGMGVRFDRLAEGSQSVLERILAEKVKQVPQRAPSETTKPPLFTDTPTRVAPAPVQDALLNNERPRRRADEAYNDQHTPLPKPMPFHSDADEFPDEAFEEATKVRALDELIAQTAEGGAGSPPDELAQRRGERSDATLPDPALASQAATTSIGVPRAPMSDRDSAPGLPSPPEPVSRASPRLLDTTPSPRTEPADGDALAVGARTQLGFDAPKLGPQMGPAGPTMGSPSIRDAVTRPSGVRAVAAEPTSPTRMPVQNKSAAPIIILVLVLAAAAAAGVWFFVLRDKAVEGQAGSGAVAGSGSAGSGSAGTAVATGSDGSDGSNGSNQPITPGSNAPAVELVETTIASSVDKSTIEIVGTDQTGPAPLTAKLEKNRSYKARVIAPGFAMIELDVTGGQDKVTAKLVAKPRVISINTTPPGALIFIDSAATGHSSPFDIELTKAQAAKQSVRVALRKGGYKPIERVVGLAGYTEDTAKMVSKLDEQLSVQIYRPTPPDRTNTNQGSNQAGSDASSAGSAQPPPNGSGATSGSSGTTSGSGTTPAAGSGSATPPPPKPSSEPEPDFVKKP